MMKVKFREVDRSIDRTTMHIIGTLMPLLMGLFIIGVGVCVVDPVFFPRPSKGILAGTSILSSTRYPNSTNNFVLEIYDISTDNSSAKSELYVYFTLVEVPKDNDTLVFVIPYQVQDCSIYFQSYETQEQLSINYNQNLDCSYISVPLRHQIDKSVSLTLRFTWRFFVKSSSFDTFDLVLPIGLTDQRVVQNTNLSTIIDPPQFSEARISISDPSDGRNIAYYPAPNKVHAYNGRLWNSWILDAQQPSIAPPLASIKMEYIVERFADEKEFRILLAGALLGLGATLIVEFFLQVVKERT
jgi:hypothetical protein